jgi:hypothetical protein
MYDMGMDDSIYKRADDGSVILAMRKPFLAATSRVGRSCFSKGEILQSVDIRCDIFRRSNNASYSLHLHTFAASFRATQTHAPGGGMQTHAPGGGMQTHAPGGEMQQIWSAISIINSRKLRRRLSPALEIRGLIFDSKPRLCSWHKQESEHLDTTASMVKHRLVYRLAAALWRQSSGEGSQKPVAYREHGSCD